MDKSKQDQYRDKTVGDAEQDAWRMQCRVEFVGKEIGDRQKAIYAKEAKFDDLTKEIKEINDGPEYHKKENRQRVSELMHMRDEVLLPALKQDKDRLGTVMMESSKFQGQADFYRNFAAFASTWVYRTEDEKLEEAKKNAAAEEKAKESHEHKHKHE